MDTINSFVSFFYNIIPGFIFLIINSLFFWPIQKYIFEANKHSFIGFIPVFVISIFLGFLFQSFTKILRDGCLDQKIINKIERDDKELLIQAKHELRKIQEVKDIETKKLIFIIHNYLFSQYDKLVPEFNMSRLAFWSNMFFVFMISIICILLSPYFNICPHSISGYMLFDITILIVFDLLSLNTYQSYHYAFYDSLLRTFISVRMLGKQK